MREMFIKQFAHLGHCVQQLNSIIDSPQFSLPNNLGLILNEYSETLARLKTASLRCSNVLNVATDHGSLTQRLGNLLKQVETVMQKAKPGPQPSLNMLSGF